VSEERDGAARAAELRRAFDGTFAAPPLLDDGDATEALLAVRAGADACVVRLSEMRGLVARPTVVALPGPLPELLGLASLRGALIPVYRLAALQGQPVTAAPAAWMMLVEADGLVGLAFEELLGYLRVQRSAIAALPDASGAPGASWAARIGDALRPLIDVPSLIEGLRRRARAVGAHTEE